MSNDSLRIAQSGEKITITNGQLNVPDHPIIPYITGDGIGADISPVMLKVVNAAVSKAYQGNKKIEWLKVWAGDEAIAKNHPELSQEQIKAIPPAERQKLYLPEETIQVIRDYLVGIKGPLTTPVGGGIRSLNVTLRKVLDLYACVRPVRHIGTPAPVKRPQDLDIVFFRENTEDVYAGIEWEKGTEEAKKLIDYLRDEFGVHIRTDSGIGIKPISEFATKRLVRKAIQYALKNKESPLP